MSSVIVPKKTCLKNKTQVFDIELEKRKELISNGKAYCFEFEPGILGLTEVRARPHAG